LIQIIFTRVAVIFHFLHLRLPLETPSRQGNPVLAAYYFYYDASVDSNHFHKGCRYFPLPSP